MFVFTALLTFVRTISASFCGSSTVPYSIEVLPGGATILGCARPSCFGWDPSSGMPSSDDTGFSDQSGHPDGFIRDGPTQRQPFDPNQPGVHQQQRALCTASMASECGLDQWVGGIAPLDNASSTLTAIQCCTFEPLARATDRGIATVNAGQVVIGGEVENHSGVQSHFDYISSVRRVRRPDGSVGLNVGMSRFECEDIPFPPPPAPIQNTQPLPPVQPFFQPGPQAPPALLPPAAPVYYPTSGAGASYYCFTADSEVRLVDGSVKRLDQLKKGDWVQTLSETENTFMAVSFWLHREPKEEAEFVRLNLSDGTTLKLTAQHYIYKTDCRLDGVEVDFSQVARGAVYAENVMEGDCVYSVPQQGKPILRKVTAIDRVSEVGVYAPMVTNGKIVVNGVHASCHSVMRSQILMNSFFSTVEVVRDMFSTLVGSASMERELPFGVETGFSISEYVLPKNLALL